MSWIGTWPNQYGSIVRIVSVVEGRIDGKFETALEDRGFYGQEESICGIIRGNCISLSAACVHEGNDMVVSHTGLLREDRTETMWFFAADTSDAGGMHEQVPWRKAVITNADTFERVESPLGEGMSHHHERTLS